MEVHLFGKEKKDVMVVGAALFAMFFGAGNLIFPPSLGFNAGEDWFLCMLGFFMTGVGLPILGVIAVARKKGSFDNLASKVSPGFAKILGSVIVLSIGPFLAIPRTEATVYEIGIKPLFANSNPLFVSSIYFVITLLFVLKPSGVIDKVGKYLTPMLLIIITTIIAKGLLSPMGVPTGNNLSAPFSNGFIEGYQTMDALASILFGGLVLTSLKQKGYTDSKKQINLACMAGIIAGLGLMFVYGGLLYLGSTGSGIFDAQISKTALLINIINSFFGTYGRIATCAAVSAACLTTSIGLTAVVGNYFTELTKGKLSYNVIITATVIVSTFISAFGVEKIVHFSVPLLLIAFPIVIVLIILTIVKPNISTNIYRGAVAGTLFVSIIDALNYLKVDTGIAGQLIEKLPMHQSGFSWLIPSIACAVILEIAVKLFSKQQTQDQSVNPS